VPTYKLQKKRIKNLRGLTLKELLVDERFKKKIVRLCYQFSAKTCGAVDVEEFKSIANYQTGLLIHKYDRKHGMKLEHFLYQRIKCRFLDYLRDIDPMSRTARKNNEEPIYIVPLEPHHDTEQEVYENKDVTDLLRVMMDVLNPVERTVITTKHLRGMKFPEAARQCNIPVKKFRKMHALAMERMRARYEQLQEDKGQRSEDTERLLKVARTMFG
jgi:RNA polymerase sigma factor (sigma-70 family)